MGVFETILAESTRRPGSLSRVIDRRAVKRDPMLRTSTTGMTSHLWELEMVPAFGLIRLCEDIDKLAKNTLDQNIFFESPVLRSAWPRLTSLLAPHGAWMLCLWESTGKDRSLRLFMPVRLNKVGFPAKKVLEPLANQFMPLGTPMIDKNCSDEAAETLFRLLADPCLRLPNIIDFIWQREGGKTHQTLERAATSLGLKTQLNVSFKRAALFPDADKGQEQRPTLSKKRRRELARQLRKLEELGPIKFDCARTSAHIHDAIESFLTLELKGWKGRKGTALYNHKKIAAFSRQIVSELAAENHCEIYSLNQNDKPIASLIMLGRDGRLVPWKMAFDESLSAYSPGMQVMVNATQILKGRRDFVEADSLAVADHVMMNRVWPDRVSIADLTIGLTPAAARQLDSVIEAKRRLQTLKSFAKKLLGKLGIG
ncbi:MAG: GNAT family N-acetyltransferase [Rhizobiaceae bacterium]